MDKAGRDCLDKWASHIQERKWPGQWRSDEEAAVGEKERQTQQASVHNRTEDYPAIIEHC